MKRSKAHDSRYDQVPGGKSTKTSRYYKCSREHGRRDAVSEESSRREDSSQRYTDESEEAERVRKNRRQWTNELTPTTPNHGQNNKAFSCKYMEPNINMIPPCFIDPKNYSVPKKNKKTQKNLISPTPSFLPPTSRKCLSSQGKNKIPSGQLSRVVENGSSPKPPSRGGRKVDSAEEETLCFHHHQQHRHGDQYGECSKKYAGMQTSCNHYEELGDAGAIVSPEDTIKPSSGEPDADVSKHFTDISDTSKRRESSERNEAKGSGSKKSGDFQNRNSQIMGKPETVVQPFESEREIAVLNPSFSRNKEGGQNEEVNKKSLTREKLVYVVEEDGKGATKMETDLFTVNEILTIKKDLLELSEFAKKLKKLKEMKRETDRLKKNGKTCYCKPASDLLKDVNERIEALETRQEELEKGNFQNNGKKGSDASGTINADAKTTVASVPKTTSNDLEEEKLAASKPNAVPSRADGFFNNSEIVCELMNIKSQIQKLEKRKMLSKACSPQNLPPSSSKELNKRGHAIAVFSSKTYILASPDNFKTKQDKMDRGSPDFTFGKLNGSNENAWKSKTEKTKENVAKWLKNVPVNENDFANDFGIYVATEKRKNRFRENGRDNMNSMRCKQCNTQIRNEDYEIQEPKKNRASEQAAPGQSDQDKEKRRCKQTPEDFNADLNSPLQFEECFLTTSGKLLACGRKLASSLAVPETPPKKSSPEKLITSTLMNLLHRSASSCSSPSTFVIDDRLKKQILAEGSKVKELICSKASRSKSLEDLPSRANLRNPEKMSRNTAMRMLNGKERKESKNEIIKKEKENIKCGQGRILERGDLPATYSSRSYLVGEVNLEKTSESIPVPLKTSINNPQLFPTAAMIKPGFQVTSDVTINEINVLSCENKREKNKKRKEKKRCKADCEKSTEKIYICKVCQKEKSKPKKKKKKCDECGKKREKKHCEKVSKAICVPIPDPHRRHKTKRMHCTRRGRCNYHFKTGSEYAGSTKQQQCNCCVKTCDNYTMEPKAEQCELQKWKFEDNSDYSYKEYLKRCQRKLEEERCQRKLEEERCRKKSQEEICQRELEEVMKPQCLSKIDVCQSNQVGGLASFFRNLRNLYPRCSYLKFFPAFRTPCDKDGAVESEDKECKKSCKAESLKNKISDPCCNDGYGKPKAHRGSTLNKCREKLKKINIYMQTQISDPEEEGSSKTSGSDTSSSFSSQSESRRCRGKKFDQNFMFPYRRPMVYHVGCADVPNKTIKVPCRCIKIPRKREEEPCKGTDSPCKCCDDTKKSKKEKKKEKKKRKKEKKEKQKKNKKCVCFICGNVHKKKKCKKKDKKKDKKKKKKKKHHEVTYDDDDLCREIEVPEQPVSEGLCSLCEKKTTSESSCSQGSDGKRGGPLSFLRSFCSKKSKASGKRSSSIFGRLSDVRRIKFCKGKSSKRKKTRHRKSKKRKRSRENEKHAYTANPIAQGCLIDDKCHCSPVLNDIKGRLTALENSRRSERERTIPYSCDSECPESCFADSKKRHKKEKNKRKKEKEKEKKKKKKKKKKEEEEEDSDLYDCYIDYDICDQPAAAYYYTCPIEVDRKRVHGKRDRKNSLENTTTTTATTTNTTGDTTCTTTATTTATTNTTTTTTDYTSTGTGNTSTDTTTNCMTTTTTTTTTTNTTTEENRSSESSVKRLGRGLRQRLSSIPVFWARLQNRREEGKKRAKAEKKPFRLESGTFTKIIPTDTCSRAGTRHSKTEKSWTGKNISAVEKDVKRRKIISRKRKY